MNMTQVWFNVYTQVRKSVKAEAADRRQLIHSELGKDSKFVDSMKKAVVQRLIYLWQMRMVYMGITESARTQHGRERAAAATQGIPRAGASITSSKAIQEGGEIES